jgi:signal transduction histidine kinase
MYDFADATKVLLVDDDPLVRDFLSETIQSDTFDVETCKDGLEAWDYCQKHKDIKVIVLDIVMPKIDGMTLMKQLRDSGNEVPIIILTSKGEVSVALKALNEGASDYLIKDEGIQKTIMHSIDRVLEKQRILDENKQLMVELERSVKETNAKNIDLQREISERKKAEEESISAREEAIRANKAKSEFLSHMSHELRTPLNAIIGFAQLLKRNKEQNFSERQRNNTEEIIKAGKHLLELISEVLDLAKIESGTMTVSLEEVDLNELIDEVISLILPLAEARNIRIINYVTHYPDLVIMADRVRLKQVLLNLGSNAVKYNSESGKITLDCEVLENSRVAIKVSDTGEGLSAEDQKALFEPFQRLDAEGTEIEGTGIGLTITKNLVELMEGQLSVTSEVGKGSCFIIELQKVGDTGQKIEPVLEIEEGEEVKNEIKEEEVKFTLLYVEDNPTNLNLVQQIVMEDFPDINLLDAPNAPLGLEMAKAHKPKLILMDINLPGMDGFEAFEKLKTYEETKDIPVIAISANAMQKQIERAKEVGFAEYIVKPIDPNDFSETLEGYFKEK